MTAIEITTESARVLYERMEKVESVDEMTKLAYAISSLLSSM